VARLPHGYTNHTRRNGNIIEKRYEGVDRFARAQREFASLSGLFGHYPVPEVVQFDASVPVLMLSEITGRHGQEAINDGRGAAVLRLIGKSLADLHQLDPSLLPGLEGSGDVIVHGDFGPQNILCSLDRTGVSGVLDWELAHLGSPVEDLAWTEWIIRTHHPEARDDLPELLAGSGLSISWSDRQSSMVRQCRHYIVYCEASGLEAAAVDWRRRLRATEQWRE
jgi:aminoglycoside phosphotransferase